MAYSDELDRPSKRPKRKAPSSFTHFTGGYAKPFASALLKENCRGGKALSKSDKKTREELEDLSSASE